MTVSEVYHSPTDDLASHSRFFPVDIHVPHHQLRNFISTVYQDHVYYVHNYDIYVIDLQKQQRSLIATVPFEARCLAAAHGWVCVGGEMKGDCAFVRIGEDESRIEKFGLDLVVDMLGKEIVNSMTIHRIPARKADQSDEIVVLISNNDKSVTLYSLSQQEVLCVLEHPKAMNYASMSPDCTIIAAVGDSNEVYFYQRSDAALEHGSNMDLSEYAEYEWKPLAIPQIAAGEKLWDDYSFAVAFSPNGSLCAVSAQGGVITVFDMEVLMENTKTPEIAVICTFRSSRTSLCGFVRSMAFSPSPWDLLAWAEDHGKVGIADVRRKFVRRQCLSLDRNSSNVVQWEDTTPSEYSSLNVKERLKYQHSQRMQSLRGHPPVGARSFDDTQREQTRSNVFSYTQGLDLDESERSVLEALETTMDDIEHRMSGPYSVNYTSAPNVRPSEPTRSREYESQPWDPSTQPPPAHAVPQRRSSVVLSESTQNRHLLPHEPTRTTMTASPAPISEDNSTPPMSTNDLTPAVGSTSSQPMPYNIPPSHPWHVIEAALAASRARDEATAAAISYDSPAALIQIESAIFAERRLSDRLERQMADERRLSALLRVEVEARERLLEARQQELQVSQLAETRLSPSLERVLHRQLQIEQENGRQRSNELETEIRTNTQRVERLMYQRELLLGQARDSRQDSGTSARSSALPTTYTRGTELGGPEMTLRRMEEERRARRLRIQELEIQLRRAETRVELASVNQTLHRAEMNDRQQERILDARFLSAARSTSSSAGVLRNLRNTAPENQTQTAQQPAAGGVRGVRTRRSEVTANVDRAAIPRGSELHGRVSDSDMRMARIVMQRTAMDANGNWNASNGLRNVLSARRVQARTGVTEAMMTEAGVGTAGIGWSPDGSFLYAGTEAGIFEFKINIRDRMCFPALDMR